MTYHEASDKCRHMGAILASITSKKEDDLVYSKLHGSLCIASF